jgi:hypothetical protein
MPPPSRPTIIGSTTLRTNSAAMPASMALPPSASISAPAAEASGWLVTTMPRLPVAGRLLGAKTVPARLRQSWVIIGGASGYAASLTPHADGCKMVHGRQRDHAGRRACRGGAACPSKSKLR